MKFVNANANSDRRSRVEECVIESVERYDPSGSGINSASPGTGAKRPAFQSALACSMRSRELETKFHQRYRGPSSGSPPSNSKRTAEAALTRIVSPDENTKSRPGSK